MSDSQQTRPYTPTKIPIDDYERMAKLFKGLFAEEPGIKWAIYLAGVGGACATLDFIWKVIQHFHP
jgi:hypothetical protein